MLAAAPGPGGLPPFDGLTVLTQARLAAASRRSRSWPSGPSTCTASGGCAPRGTLVPRPGPCPSSWAGSGTLAVALCSGLARLRPRAVRGPHGPAHAAGDGRAGLPGARGAGHAGPPDAAAAAPRPAAERAALPGGQGRSASRRSRGCCSSGSPFALYFSGWYPATLESPVLHDLLHLHFVAGRLPVLLADPGHRPRAGPGQPPVPDPDAVRHHAVPRVPGRRDHERRRRRQGAAGGRRTTCR